MQDNQPNVYIEMPWDQFAQDVIQVARGTMRQAVMDHLKPYKSLKELSDALEKNEPQAIQTARQLTWVVDALLFREDTKINIDLGFAPTDSKELNA